MPIRIFAQVRTSGITRDPRQIEDALDLPKIAEQTAQRFKEAWRFNMSRGTTGNLRESLQVNFHARGWEITSDVPYARAVASQNCALYRTINDANIAENVALVARDNLGRFAKIQ